MAIDLLFTWAPATSGYLVFGDSGVSPPTPDALISLKSSLPELAGSIEISIPLTLHLSAELPELSGVVNVIGNGRVTVDTQAQLPELTGTVPVHSYPIHMVSVVGELPGLTGHIPVASYPIFHLSALASLPELAGTIELSTQKNTAEISIAADLPELGAVMQIRYDSQTQRPYGGTSQAVWQSAKILHVSSSAGFQDAIPVPHDNTEAWNGGLALPADHASSWQEAHRLQAPVGALYEGCKHLQKDALSRYEEAIRVSGSARARFQDGIRLGQGQWSRFQETYRDRVNDSGAVFCNGVTRTHARAAPAGSGLRVFSGMKSLYSMAIWPAAGVWIRPVPDPDVIYTHRASLLFAEPWASAMEMIFISDKDAEDIWDGLPPKALVTVPVLEFYMIFNTSSLRRIDGNIELPSGGMSLNLDADSWAWGFSASMPGSVLADLEPASSGAPVELEAMVNGTAFRLLVEGIGRDRTFGKSDIRVSGRGKTALLDAPYAPVLNFGNAGSDRTAQQLMLDVLSVNGVQMDWALDWQLEDWLVPAGVFSHQGSYISALNAIAAAAGGYIQPDAALQTIRVLPRYPSAPWEWEAVVPDFELPAHVATRESIEWLERARYNRIFVSGQQAGVLGRVTRAGTAGDLIAPMVVDPLITSASAARQRAISVLSNTGRQANITLGLPVLAETGVILPGSMVRYVDAGVSRLGIARGVGLTVGFPEIWQSIGVQTHV